VNPQNWLRNSVRVLTVSSVRHNGRKLSLTAANISVLQENTISSSKQPLMVTKTYRIRQHRRQQLYWCGLRLSNVRIPSILKHWGMRWQPRIWKLSTEVSVLQKRVTTLPNQWFWDRFRMANWT